MGSFFRCEFEDCPFSSRSFYSEKKFFKKHLVFNHGFENLLELAYQKGIVADPYRCRSYDFLVNEIVKISKVSRK